MFRICAVAGLLLGNLALPGLSAASAPIAHGATQGAWHFVSAPSLHPPRLQVLTRSGAAIRGDFLVDTMPNVGQSAPLDGQAGPMILDSALRPVWFHGVGAHHAAGNPQQEIYRGHPVLVWWDGGLTRKGTSIRIPALVVMNEQYRRIATLQATGPWLVDPHDNSIAGSDVWVIVGRYLHNQNLTPYGGSTDGTLYDCGVQEYDLQTGKLLYTWDALNPGGRPHVPLSQSEVSPPASDNSSSGAFWDPYHCNSLQLLPHHRMLLSMRNTSSIYLLDRAGGRIVWTLGGKHSSFKQGRHAHFAWQHDTRLVSRGASQQLTLFNDNCCGDNNQPAGRQSLGMIISLSTRTHRSELVAAYHHRPPLIIGSCGSLQLLSGGNVLVGWSNYLSEYSRSGKQLLDARWPGLDRGYRARYTDTWVGKPYYPPSGAVRQLHGRTVVYASWNGATQVSRWAVLAGGSTQALRRVGTQARTGFETHLILNRRYRVYEVQALDARGRVLRTSRPFSN